MLWRNLAVGGQQFEVGQNLTHRHLLQLSSQVVRLVSAEAMAVGLKRSWEILKEGLWGSGEGEVCSVLVISDALAASTSQPSYQYDWPLNLKVKPAQFCLTLCDPMDCIVLGILQARILELVAFPNWPLTHRQNHPGS